MVRSLILAEIGELLSISRLDKVSAFDRCRVLIGFDLIFIILIIGSVNFDV